MGDSDDEYERGRRRDKFSREIKRDFDERSGNKARQHDAFGRDRRDRFPTSPGRNGDQSPPNKRIRGPGGRDYDERSDYNRDYDNRNRSSSRPNNNNGGRNDNESSSKVLTQPPMMSFKQFIETCDEHLEEDQVVQEYGRYKNKFRATQIRLFFDKHKDEEWFKHMYHPEMSESRRQEMLLATKHRLNVFIELMQKEWIDKCALDVNNMTDIIKILDAAFIKLEGGTDFDLKSLDHVEVKPKVSTIVPAASLFSLDTDVPFTPVNVKVDADSKEADDAAAALSGDIIPVKTESEEKAGGDGPHPEKSDETSEDVKSDEGVHVEEKKEEKEEPKPRPLHKSVSLFLRNLHPTITREAVITEAQNFPGFLRCALAPPTNERRYYRKGWVTYDASQDIKSICFAFQNIKFEKIENNAIVNKELNRRIRSVNGVSSYKNVIRADIRHAAKVVYQQDKLKGLWIKEGVDVSNPTSLSSFAADSSNPLLKGITDYLIEEGSAEEEELVGEDGVEEGADSWVETDENVLRYLDRLLLYLRIVHCIDYYNHADYPQEDEMPNRIGIMHVRGVPPTSPEPKNRVNDYLKSFEDNIKPFMHPPPKLTPEEASLLGYMVEDEEVEKFITSNIVQKTENKVQCMLCEKKFKANEFVRKHIMNKYEDRMSEVRATCAYFNRYLCDPKRPQLPEHQTNKPGAARESSSASSSAISGNGARMPPNPWAPPMAMPSYMGPGFPYGFPQQRPPQFMGMNQYGMMGGINPMGGGGHDHGMGGGGGGGGGYKRPVHNYRDLDNPDNESRW